MGSTFFRFWCTVSSGAVEEFREFRHQTKQQLCRLTVIFLSAFDENLTHQNYSNHLKNSRHCCSRCLQNYSARHFPTGVNLYTKSQERKASKHRMFRVREQIAQKTLHALLAITVRARKKRKVMNFYRDKDWPKLKLQPTSIPQLDNDSHCF